MIGFTAEDLVDLRRWAICGAIVVLTHGGIAAAMVSWRDSDEAAEPAAAIVIEFAPVPVAPAMPQMEIPPGPEQVMSDASPNKPTESLEEKIEEKIEQKVEAKLEQKVEEKVDSKPVEEPPPEVAPAPDPEVAVQPPQPQEVKQETPKRQEPRPPDGGDPGGAHAGPARSDQLERGADVEDADRGIAGAQQALSGDGAIPSRTRGGPGFLQPRPARARARKSGCALIGCERAR
jgi:protein TonB